MATLVSLAGILTEQEEAFCMDIAMGVRYVDAFRQHSGKIRYSEKCWRIGLFESTATCNRKS